MVHVKALAEYQEIESSIALRKKRLSEIEGQLKQTAEIKTARANLEELERRLRELKAQQKSTEWDVEQTGQRIADLEGRMMGDRVTPRDLPPIQREIGNLRERQRGLEDSVLSLMDRTEVAEKARDGQAKTVAGLDQQWREAQGHLLAEKERIEAELPEWEQRRAQRAGTLDPAARRLYEQVKAKKGGLAVVQVEGGRCNGCRITLPVSSIQRARAGNEVVYCNSCGRILYEA